MFLGLITWKIVVDPRGKGGHLSTISGALRKAIQKKNKCELHSDSEWARFDNEKKLTEVLHHVIKIYDATPEEAQPDDQNKGDQNQGNDSQPPTTRAVVS